MQKKMSRNNRETMSMEEYIKMRKKAKEEENIGVSYREEKNPVWILTELYG